MITGATGFLGQHVVRSSLQRGHEVRAVIRPASPLRLPEPAQAVRLDLRASAGLAEALEGVDVVVHAAASKSGDFHTQFDGTVRATENLLAGMHGAGVRRLVLVSSFSVYDYERIPAGAVVGETSPTGDAAAARDAYASTKLLQEQVVWAAAEEGGWSVTVARPGVVYGPENLWTARLGFGGGPGTWVCVGGSAPLPLTWVGNCGDALAWLAERDEPGVRTVNVVDADPPTQQEYRRALVERHGRPRRTVVVPWPLARLGIVALDSANAALGRPLVLPGALRRDAAVARWQPVRFSSALPGLGWQQPVPFPRTLDLEQAPSASADGSGSSR